MGIFDWLFGKRDASTPLGRRKQAATDESGSTPATLGNWRVLSGADAAREAVAQRVISVSDNFAAVLLTPVKPLSSSWVTLKGAITCHGCRRICSLEKKVMIGGGGLESSTVTCQCGSQITLMLSGASQHGAGFVVVSPFTSIRGQTVSQIGLRLDSITEEYEGPRQDQPPPQAGGKAVILTGHTAGVQAVAVSPDGKSILSGAGGKSPFWEGEDYSVRLWDVESGQELRQFIGHQDGINWVSFTEDGEQVVSGGGDINGKREFCFRFWDLQTGEERHRFDSPRSNVSAMAASADGKLVAFGGGYGDSYIRVYQADTGSELYCFDEQTTLMHIVFSPNGKRLLSAAASHVSCWDLETGRLVHRLGGTDEVYGLALAPDERRAAFGGYAKFVGLWDLASGKETRRLLGHTKSISAVAFASDGRRLASAGSDMTVSVWDADTGKEVCRFEGHTAGVKALTFTPDSQSLVSASEDKTLRLWSVA